MSNNVFVCITSLMVASTVGLTMANSLCENGSDLLWRRDPISCNIAYFCILGRAVTYTCPEGHVIGSNKRFCVPVGSDFDDCTGLKLKKSARHIDVSAECKFGDNSADESNCAKYFECVTLPAGNTTMLGKECPYPLLFDTKSGKCEQYKEVECLPNQKVPKSPCDYESNQCTSAHCVPCNIRFPSCTGRPDGMNTWEGKEWSPYYVVCQEERMTLQGECKSDKVGQIFHPEKNMCVEVDEKTIIG